MTEKSIQENIQEWLKKEGYPLEFQTTNIFRQNGFQTKQGQYVKDFKTQLPREIDVKADKTVLVNDSEIIRITYLVECKWTANKPWIIFSDKSSRIGTVACISQTVASQTAEAILWCLARDSDVQTMSIFKTPSRPGFNGRQAFGENDMVYSALQGVMSATYSEKEFYDRQFRKQVDKMTMSVIIVPIIVIQGRLFEAYYNTDTNKVETQEQSKIRLHWKGSEAWRLHSTVDIVTIDHLDEYVRNLSPETDLLLKKMIPAQEVVKRCLSEKTIDPLQEIPSAQGIRGLPQLLKHLKKEK